MNKEKTLRNLEKLLNRDFDFINAGRIVMVSDNKKIDINLVKDICHKLNINAMEIRKAELIKIIDYVKSLENIE